MFDIRGMSGAIRGIRILDLGNLVDEISLASDTYPRIR